MKANPSHRSRSASPAVRSLSALAVLGLPLDVLGFQQGLSWVSCAARTPTTARAVEDERPPRAGDCLVIRSRTDDANSRREVWAAYLISASFPSPKGDAQQAVTTLELAVQELPPSIGKAAGQDAIRLTVDDVLVIPFSNTNTRLSLIDCLTHTGKARLTLATGLPPSPCSLAALRSPVPMNPKLAAGFQSMARALDSLLGMDHDCDALREGDDTQCKQAAQDSDVLQRILKVGGTTALRAVATRILPPLANFPAFLAACARDAMRGAKVCFVEGPPGAAKADQLDNGQGLGAGAAPQPHAPAHSITGRLTKPSPSSTPTLTTQALAPRRCAWSGTIVHSIKDQSFSRRPSPS